MTDPITCPTAASPPTPPGSGAPQAHGEGPSFDEVLAAETAGPEKEQETKKTTPLECGVALAVPLAPVLPLDLPAKPVQGAPAPLSAGDPAAPIGAVQPAAAAAPLSAAAALPALSKPGPASPAASPAAGAAPAIAPPPGAPPESEAADPQAFARPEAGVTAEAVPPSSNRNQPAQPAAGEAVQAAGRQPSGSRPAVRTVTEAVRADAPEARSTAPPPEAGAPAPAADVGRAGAPSTIEPARSAEARSPQIVDQVKHGVEALAREGRSSLRLQLHPESLGRIDLRLSSGPEGVRVVLNADLASTGGLLESHLRDLRHSLTDAGLQVSDVLVGGGWKDASAGAFAWDRPTPQAPAAATRAAEAVADDAPRAGRSAGLVDLRA